MRMFLGLMTSAVLIVSSASAQYPREERRYERPDGGFNVIRAVQGDLERVASRGRMGGRERNRIDQALRSLNDFERDLSRGRFDRHDLDKAIGRVDDVVRRGAIDNHERNILIGDLNRLRQFRFEASYRR